MHGHMNIEGECAL